MKKISRKDFIKLSSVLVGGSLLIPRWLHAASLNMNNLDLLRNSFNDKIIVIVNLNGGNDGLNTVIPYQDSNYYNLRPDIAIQSDSVLPITSDLGLHPSLTHLANYWNQGKLCVVENVGYDNQNLSHFRSTDIWQSASNSEQVLNTGWLARVLEQVYPNYNEQLPETPMALLQGTTNQLLLTGEDGITGIMVDDPASFLDLVNSTFYGSPDNIIPETAGGDELQFIRAIDNSAFQYAEYIQAVSDAGINTMEYANNPLSVQLSSAAKLISGGMYSPFFVVYQNGYDTHSDQLNRHSSLMSDLSLALYNFYNDLENQGLAEKVIVMTTSEFGRRPFQNGGGGTDHGTAAPMFILGNTVNGGIIGNTPNLSSFNNNNNLLYEYDYRQVYSSLLAQHFGLSSDLIDIALLNSFENLDIISGDDNQLGDVNFDNEVNVIDIVIMVNFILGVTNPTEEEFSVADVNQDGSLDVLDIVRSVSNIIGTANNLSYFPKKSLKIEHSNDSITIEQNNQLGGIEIHFEDNCKITDSVIDDGWIIRSNNKKVILYSLNLELMKNNFFISFSKYSKIDRIIISDKNGRLIKSRVYKK
ncbi:DUF1501 domain-containing protein [Candidatus Marinimicrobia bacterium]|nr:DUF1501 domain-containing protein [Candidatus Neomarinimicrobiota bacterium]